MLLGVLLFGIAHASETVEILAGDGWSCTTEDPPSCSTDTVLGEFQAVAKYSFCDPAGHRICRRAWAVPAENRRFAEHYFFKLSMLFEQRYQSDRWTETSVGGHPVARLEGPTWLVAFQVKDDKVIVVEELRNRRDVQRDVSDDARETILQCVEVVEKTNGTTVSLGTANTQGSARSQTTVSPTVSAPEMRLPGDPVATADTSTRSSSRTVSAGVSRTNSTTRSVEEVRYIRFDEENGTIRLQGVDELIADADGWARAEVAEFEPTKVTAGYKFKAGVRVTNAILSLGTSESGPFAGLMVSELDRVSGKWRVAGHTFTCELYEAENRRF